MKKFLLAMVFACGGIAFAQDVKQEVWGKGLTEKEVFQWKTIKETTLKGSAVDITEEYKENCIAADKKYKGKEVLVLGSISDFSNTLGRPCVELLCSTYQYENLRLYFDPLHSSELENLQKKQFVVVVGTCSGKSLSAVTFKNCRIVFAENQYSTAEQAEKLQKKVIANMPAGWWDASDASSSKPMGKGLGNGWLPNK